MNNISLNCLLNRNFLPANIKRSNTIFLNIEVSPVEPLQQERLPSIVALVIDKSGSMAGKKIDVAKEAAIKFVQSLDDNDYMAIIAFSDKIDTVFNGYIGDEKSGKGLFGRSSIENSILGIKAEGTTNLYGAIEKAFDEINAMGGTGSNFVKKIVLLSDGCPTVGPAYPSDFAYLAGKISEIGVSITSAGIGNDYNEDILITLAEYSGGKFKHIIHSDQIIDLFMEESTRIKSTTMIQPKIIVKLSIGVEIGKIYKAKPEVYECKNVRFTGKEYIIPISNLVLGEQQTYVVELHVPPHEEGIFRIARVDMEGCTGKDIVVTYTSDPAFYDKENFPVARELFLLTEYKTKLRNALSRDETLIRDVDDTILNYIKDPSLQEEVIRLKNTTTKAKSGLTEGETKIAKEDLTKFRGG